MRSALGLHFIEKETKASRSQQLRWSKWWSRRTWSSSPPINTSKIYLHVGQFSMKMNWKLAEELLYNQSCNKDLHVTGYDGKKRYQIRTCIPGRDLKGRKGPHGWTFTLGSEQIKPQFGHPIPGIPAQRIKVPLPAGKFTETDRKTEEV